MNLNLLYKVDYLFNDLILMNDFKLKNFIFEYRFLQSEEKDLFNYIDDLF